MNDYAIKVLRQNHASLSAIRSTPLSSIRNKKASEIKWWSGVIDIDVDKISTVSWDNISQVKLLRLGSVRLFAIRSTPLSSIRNKKASQIKWWDWVVPSL